VQSVWRALGVMIVKQAGAQSTRQNSADWRCEVVHDAPVQTTDCDCAVFVCAIAERLSAGCAVTVTQDDVPGLRRRMLLAFYNNRVD